MAAKLRAIYHKIVQIGVCEATPPALIDRIVFTNFVCLIGLGLDLVLAFINWRKGYHHMLALNGVYFVAALLGLYFNHRRRYLTGKLLALSLLYLGMMIAGLIQGPVIEIEHFFLPIAVLGFSFFYREERYYSFFFLLLSVAAYLFFVNQDGPLIPVHDYPYSARDRFANQVSYLALFVACLVALSNSFERASRLIDEQRNRLFEERRLASFGAVVGNVAHEINSPLAALDVQLYQLDSLLKKDAISRPEIVERTERIRKISRRLSVIVRSLKFVSGQDTGDAMLNSPLGAVVESALDLTRDRMEKEGIRFRNDIKSSSREIACRPVALSQVFLNLLNNAIDAVEDLPSEHRWILMDDFEGGQSLSIRLTDGGSISSPETRKALFRNFFTTKPGGRGTGLGLSISRETVELHGGKLWFDSESPNTRFVVELPLPRGAG